jgi:hypothetical protein
MRILETNICIGLGDALYTRGMIDPFKDRFDQIKISFDKGVINTYKPKDNNYLHFLNDIGKLLFSESPFIFNAGQFKIRNIIDISRECNFPLVKPNLKNIMCKGALLNLEEPYLVITTKHRFFPRTEWNRIKDHFWYILTRLSKKYIIVILGEKEIEKSKENIGWGENNIYSIYYEVISRIPQNRYLDLTIPALGITAPNLKQIQQDCMIMSEAEFVILFGNGGHFCMATSVANSIGYNINYSNPLLTDPLFDILFRNTHYPDAFFTQDWMQFSNKLESYL